MDNHSEQKSMQAHLERPLQPQRDSKVQSSVSVISSSLKTNHRFPIRIQLTQCPQFYPVPKCTTTPTKRQSPSWSFSPSCCFIVLSQQFVLILSLQGKGTCQFSLVMPFLASSYLKRRRCTERKFGSVLIRLHLLASTRSPHLSHLNLSRPVSRSARLQLLMQQLSETLGSGRIKLMSTYSSSRSETAYQPWYLHRAFDTCFADGALSPGDSF